MPHRNHTHEETGKPIPAQSFGDALRFLRKRAHLTQDELGRMVGYSREQIARLENGSRLPDLAVIAALFIPALDIGRQSQLSQQLLELAGQTRSTEGMNQRITVSRTVQTRTQRAVEVVSEETPQFHLPAPLFPILGRETELARVTDLLLNEARLVTLIGAPGIGKTRLAIEAAHTLKPYFPDGVCFVGLDSIQQAEDVPATIASVLELSPSAEQLPVSLIRSFLSSKNILLVLDNCEHVLDAVELFGECLSAAPDLKLLCTSRAALDLYGEYEWELFPLALPNLAHLPEVDELSHIASVRLFIARCRTALPTFSLNIENALSISTLCTVLDGLPLALEIAAARVRDHSVQDVLQQIMAARGNPQLASTPLQQTKRNIAERHQALNHAIAWSFRLLPVEAQNVFARLGVMNGGCTLNAARQVCGAEPENLKQLASASLLRLEEDRVFMLETLRAFAFEQLIREGLADDTRQIHANYFAGYAQEVFNGIRGSEQELWLANARRDHANFRAALRYAIEKEDAHLAVAIAGGLWWFWHRQGHIREGKQWLETSLNLPMLAPMTDEQKRNRATALNGAGSICAELGDFDQAVQYHAEGLNLRRELKDQDGISIVLHNMGLTERSRGNYAASLRLQEEALTHTSLDNIGSLAMSYTNLGLTAAMMYDLPLASQWLQRSVDILNEVDFSWELAYTLNVYANVSFEMKDFQQAGIQARDSLRIFEKLGDAIFSPEPQLMLAKIAHVTGDGSTAYELCSNVLKQYQQMEDQYGVANVLHVLAWLALPDDPEKAQALFDESKDLRGKMNHFLSPLEQEENRRLSLAIQVVK
ncbi:MAG TPA: tetratricopeptide repeat protein [Anaerolineales bacterium]|nr:tetratricopeptide repeat protein [Anaerolineales bacterium]